MIGRSFVAMSLATMALSGAANASDTKSFKDWYAACDNLRNCSAYGFSTDLGGALGYLRIERGGAANAPIKITLSVDPNGAASYRIAFDPALPGLPDGALSGKEGEGNDYRRTVLAEGASAQALIDSIRKAKSIVVTLTPAAGKTLDTPTANVSMSGAAAALLWIDDQQKRVDTVTAMIRRGAKPASSIPAQPKAPVIVAAKPTTEKPPARQPAGLEAKGRALCGESDPKSKMEEMYALGGGQVLYEFSCPENSGAYNFQSVYMIGPANNPQAARAVSFKWPVKVGGVDQDGLQDGLINAGFNEATMTITSFSKGRGIGDCGSEDEWVWDGKAFRLAQSLLMSECNGVPLDDWPVVYRAQVQR
ncbi:DUF1176 domain-containing protein [Pseudorhodoplanes sinuspersici]|uniref:Uncharacterized protein n=1 Tax=Pseudorhodoplanes sinuspersici TaxID=1235591 RepID=A0A1W6ZSC7_9HYPH|nr:DUF1176 domain-containing protein [Pseudorhodoplanes sinuspersici]ARQ00284.1 hypothetical protein CAK95_15295 [Pseudorhodoplanes sinuspersici]RKE67560.1 uncharacterized protein DUF1176 [Pseudorhodoplanes sinuspersici]